MAVQLTQQDAENLVNHLQKAIMGYPPNSEVKQALMSAGVGICEGFAYLGWGAVQLTNYGWI